MAKTRKSKPRKSTNGSAESDTDVAETPQSAGETTPAVTDRERIEARAYELYLARGGAEGDAMDDWLEAERESTHVKKDRPDE